MMERRTAKPYASLPMTHRLMDRRVSATAGPAEGRTRLPGDDGGEAAAEDNSHECDYS